MTDLDALVGRIRRRLAWQRRWTLVCVAALVWTAVDGRPMLGVVMWAVNVVIGVVLCIFTARHLNEAITVAEWERDYGRRR